MTAYAVEHVGSWDDYLRLITDTPYANWAFRGQADANWPLLSALSRQFLNFKISPAEWLDQEERILRIFKRKAHHFLDHPPAAEAEFEWLALMQHHGAPTRLLDFTWSPYVAAFFALERATGDAAVWAVNPAEIRYVDTQVISGGARIHPLEMDPRREGNFRKYFVQAQTPFVWVGEPEAMNRRLIAQSGTFVAPGAVDRPVEEILGGYPNPKQTLVKFVLPIALMRTRGMRELYRMNITYATLFPDLDGLARSLALELEFNWARMWSRGQP
jgi:hypothetical protein